jgi:hypothetical protein
MVLVVEEDKEDNWQINFNFEFIESISVGQTNDHQQVTRKQQQQR